MPTRPSQGGSNGTWGTELNAWLDVAHNADGTVGPSGMGQLTGATAASRYVGGTTSGAPVTGTFAVGDFVVDRTGQVWICITAGTSGTWVCATKSAAMILANALGVQFEPYPYLSAVAAAAPATQSVYGVAVPAITGSVITGIKIRNAVAAAGTLPTTVRFGLADNTGKILVLSGNLTALANWTTGVCAMPFTAPFTTTYTGLYFAAYVVNGVWGTTQPTPMECSGVSAANNADGSNPPPTFIQTGQTDLPAVNSSMTLSGANNRAYYLALY